MTSTTDTAAVEVPPIMEALHITKRFEAVRALEDVSVVFRRGEVHALVGENGAGKSTLVKIIAGAYRPDSGELIRDGLAVSFQSPKAAIDAGMAVVYQEPTLLPLLTVEDNLLLGHEPKGRLGWLSGRKVRILATKYLEAVGGDIDPATPVRKLSIAQRQLVEIAKALSLDAQLVLMDEPTSSLSITETDRLGRVIDRLQSRGVGVVLVTHDLNDVIRFADRVTVLKDGQVTLSRLVSDTRVDEIVRSMVGRDLAYLFPTRTAPAPGPVVLEVQGLSVPGRAEQVSFKLRAGEVTGMAGLIGAGRTDVGRAIVGASASEGTILLDGKPIRPRQPADVVELGLAMVPEDRHAEGLVLDLPIAQNISLPQLRNLKRFGMVDVARERQIAVQQISSLRIRTDSEQRLARDLSGGNQQKVVLAKWLARKARVLILDEPTRGVDIGAKAEIYALIRELARNGTAILLISSELPEILHLSDRILVMSKGRLVAEMDNDATAATDLTAEEKMIRSALGLERNGGSIAGAPGALPPDGQEARGA
jgi:ABC-type sugar transport system ATPase subunit